MRSGRVRIALEDGSVLNVGSASSLAVIKHDAGAQQTQLELLYGRLRAKAVKISRPGGEFRVHTRTAVIASGTRLLLRIEADPSPTAQ